MEVVLRRTSAVVAAFVVMIASTGVAESDSVRTGVARPTAVTGSVPAAPASTMATGRSFHTATRLGDGSVLVAGGLNFSGALKEAERYVPDLDTWSAVPPMTDARAAHTATLLPNGNVLVAGGIGNGGTLTSAEQYDPQANKWLPAGNMADGRQGAVAVLLTTGPNKGSALVIGGASGGTTLASAEITSGDGTWTKVGSMSKPRQYPTATVLPSGEVLVAGGYSNGTVLNSAELYHPNTTQWSTVGNMNVARYLAMAAPVVDTPGGKTRVRVLVAGGFDLSNPVAGADLYDPVTQSWSATASLHTARFEATATALPNGGVLVAGGSVNASNPDETSSVEFYDPGTETWTIEPSLGQARESQTATLMLDGRVLISGGSVLGTYFASAELYAPPVPGAIPLNGLIGHWPLNGNAQDTSGNGKDGTIDLGVASVPGVDGGAFRFDGVGVIHLPHFSFPTAAYTASIWMQTGNPCLPNDGRSMFDQLSPTAGGPFELDLRCTATSVTRPEYKVRNGGTTVVNLVQAGLRLRDTRWHMITATYRNGSQSLYVDGALMTTSTFGGPLPSNTVGAAIGGHTFGATDKPWIGRLDEAVIYNRALSRIEVQQLYQAFVPPPHA